MQGIGLGLAPITMAAARDHLPADRSPAVIAPALDERRHRDRRRLPAQRADRRTSSTSTPPFFFGGAMSLVALFAALAAIPASRASSAVPLDVRGAALGGLGAVALLIGVGQGQEWGWGSPRILGCFRPRRRDPGALGAGDSCARPAPLVDLRQLRHRAVLGADLAGDPARPGALHVPHGRHRVRPDALGQGFGFGASTLVAGLVLVPFSLTSLSRTSPRDAEPRPARIGARGIVVVGALAIAVAGAPSSRSSTRRSGRPA